MNLRKKYLTFCSTLLLTACILLFSGCEGPEGPTGPEGARVEQGEVGPIGPAGEDGSMIYADSGPPNTDTGNTGDYYLDSTTGEFYGPKNDQSWGEPIIVLMGDDGEDGSQIFAGQNSPDMSLGKTGDYYLDKSNYDLYGPKADNGWGTPLNIKGADGNENVTRYIFQGHDFSSELNHTISVNPISNTEFKNSAWLVYLANDRKINNSTFRYYPIPGRDAYTYYSISFGNINNSGTAFFIEASSPGNEFERIEVVRIESTNTVDTQKVEAINSIIPEDLNVSNYWEVAQRYGF